MRGLTGKRDETADKEEDRAEYAQDEARHRAYQAMWVSSQDTLACYGNTGFTDVGRSKTHIPGIRTDVASLSTRAYYTRILPASSISKKQ